MDPDNLAGAYPVADDDVARKGAASLTSFFNGIDSSRDVDPHLTALGHSYGSLTTSLALQNGTGVDDAILFGSPGFGTNNAADLGLPPGHVFLEEAHDDPVADLGGFGRDPSTLNGVTSLATDARTLPDGTQGAREPPPADTPSTPTKASPARMVTAGPPPPTGDALLIVHNIVHGGVV